MEKGRVMTPASDRWDEFYDRMEGPEGCDFRKDEAGKITWRCEGGRDKSYAEAILKAMGGFDVAASCAFFEEMGGYCDCEILFNVEDRFKVQSSAQ